MKRRQWLQVMGLAAAGCGPSNTGSKLVSIQGALRGSPVVDFTTSRGYRVTLRRAQLRIGAVYLNERPAVRDTSDAPCLGEGTAVAQLTTGAEFDALSPELQPFPASGTALERLARSGELWLSHPGQDLDDSSTPGPILSLAGEVRWAGKSATFDTNLTIGSNRKRAPTKPELPGSNAICGERIVRPITVDFVPRRGRTLVVNVIASRWLDRLDFAQAEDPLDPSRLRLQDSNEAVLDFALLQAVQSPDAYALTLE